MKLILFKSEKKIFYHPNIILISFYIPKLKNSIILGFILK
jgi:hypothetical protein